MTKARIRISDLPLFARDAELARAIMPEGRAADWPAIAKMLEAEGLPPINPLMGGRYVPAVVEWFAAKNGIRHKIPPQPMQRVGTWNKPQKLRG